MRRPISSYHPIFSFAIVKLRRLSRRILWHLPGRRYAKTFLSENLEHRVYRHHSVLIRKLGDVDMRLQHNKVINLKLAVPKLDGILVRPGETFSFYRLLGPATRYRGYVNAMLLSGGEAVEGIGGGLCQLSNLIHWICLHSPLTVTERHHHSFDPFPDSGRVVPFGSGATVFYNYRDYQFTNNTSNTFQLRIWLDEKRIWGDLRTDEEPGYKYHVFEKNHRFVKVGKEFYRRNELWREKYIKRTGEAVEAELLQKSNSLVKYTPNTFLEVDYE